MGGKMLMTKYLIDWEEFEQDEFQRKLEDAIYDYAEHNYDNELDETYQDYEIMGLSFSASQVLKECDPTAYRCGMNDLVDSKLKEANYQLETYGEYSVNGKTFMVEEIDDEEDHYLLWHNNIRK